MNPNHYCFPVFKGLQKPLEFMGLRGRFLVLAAGGIGAAFFGFIIGSLVFSQMVGILACLIIAGGSYLFLFIKQKQGLHSKKRCRGILIYRDIFIRK